MSHPTDTVRRVISVGVFFGILLVQLPIFGVLVAGLILLGTQGHRLPPRSRLMARAGLSLMLAESVLSGFWSAVLPQMLSQVSHGADFIRTYGVANAVAGFFLSGLFAAGVALLLAALLTARQPAPSPH
jgi:hypothetical protein